jgi:hypothetical protein
VIECIPPPLDTNRQNLNAGFLRKPPRAILEGQQLLQKRYILRSPFLKMKKKKREKTATSLFLLRVPSG